MKNVRGVLVALFQSLPSQGDSDLTKGVVGSPKKQALQDCPNCLAKILLDIGICDDAEASQAILDVQEALSSGEVFGQKIVREIREVEQELFNHHAQFQLLPGKDLGEALWELVGAFVCRNEEEEGDRLVPLQFLGGGQRFGTFPYQGEEVSTELLFLLGGKGKGPVMGLEGLTG